MTNIALGDAGEKAVKDYLILNGYKVLATKYRTVTGEVDIIAKVKGTIVFIEVKTRSSNQYGSPAEAVTFSKQRKIIQTALSYLKQTAQVDAPVRFDVVEVWMDLNGGRVRLNHIINAFGER
ncbi:MAG: protein yraN [Firmicutes bacterium]|nr:protein yraN [Bacillota bacterium]